MTRFNGGRKSWDFIKRIRSHSSYTISPTVPLFDPEHPFFVPWTIRESMAVNPKYVLDVDTHHLFAILAETLTKNMSVEAPTISPISHAYPVHPPVYITMIR
jgi:hypothetical protein